MKIGIFTDSHYCRAARHKESLDKIIRALSFFQMSGCDLAIFLGDLIDSDASHAAEAENLRRIADEFDRMPFPIYVILGNHDAICLTKKDFYGILGELRRPKTVKENGKNLVFLDTFYYKTGECYKVDVRDFSEACHINTAELQAELSRLEGDTYVFTHHPLDTAATPHRRVTNSEEIFKILNNSVSVRAVFQGHDHRCIESVLNGIRYATYPALLDDGDAYFIEEL